MLNSGLVTILATVVGCAQINKVQEKPDSPPTSPPKLILQPQPTKEVHYIHIPQIHEEGMNLFRLAKRVKEKPELGGQLMQTLNLPRGFYWNYTVKGDEAVPFLHIYAIGRAIGKNPRFMGIQDTTQYDGQGGIFNQKVKTRVLLTNPLYRQKTPERRPKKEDHNSAM